MSDAPPKTTKDQASFSPLGRKSRPDSTPFEFSIDVHCSLGEALEALAEIEEKRKDRSQDLALGIEALAVVIELIQTDLRSLNINAAGPLKRVQAALHDIQFGAKPALIFARPDDDEDQTRLRGKPTNTISDSTRGRLAAAVHLLIEAGIPRTEAGRLIARGVTSRGIPIAGLGKAGVTAERVLRWRDDAGAASTQAFNEAYNQNIDGIRGVLGPDITRQQAEIAAASILQAIANWTA